MRLPSTRTDSPLFHRSHCSGPWTTLPCRRGPLFTCSSRGLCLDTSAAFKPQDHEITTCRWASQGYSRRLATGSLQPSCRNPCISASERSFKAWIRIHSCFCRWPPGPPGTHTLHHRCQTCSPPTGMGSRRAWEGGRSSLMFQSCLSVPSRFLCAADWWSFPDRPR